MEAGRAGRPILLKRGFSATLDEWLCAAEYIAREGCLDIVLCERGVRRSAFWNEARSELDLDVIGPARRATPLPVIGDPSHATGDWRRVEVASLEALRAGAHGLLIEVLPLQHGARRPALRPLQGVSAETLHRIMDFARGWDVPDPSVEGAIAAGAES